MQYSNSIKSIAIGSFDGMHIAHQALIARAEAVVVIERNGGYLTPGYKRACFTDRPCFFYHFEKIRGLTPEAFVAKLQEDFPKLEKIVVGYDFAFGKGKSADANRLRALFDGEVEIVEEVKYEGISVHSRVIKEYLKEGDILMANAMLGREYLIEGRVMRGQGIGSRELVPTLNLKIEGYQLPLEGVYATRTRVEGKWYDSVSFIGHRVSTDSSYAVETHLLDSSIEAPLGEVGIAFVTFLRENRKFETLEALKKQINRDIVQAKEELGIRNFSDNILKGYGFAGR